MATKTAETQPAATLEAVAAEQGTARVVADLVTEHYKPVEVSCTDGELAAQLFAVPKGMVLHDSKPYLDKRRKTPERRRGLAKLHYLKSFIEFLNTFKDKDSVIFAESDRQQPRLIAVLDYNVPDGSPRFGEHRAEHRFPLSDEWNIWGQMSGARMKQKEFAEFLEDRISDVMVPDEKLLGKISARDSGGDFGAKTSLEILADYARLLGGKFATPSELVTLSRGLSVHASHQVKEEVTIQTGESQIQYVEEHKDKQGSPIVVPSLFLIAIPVFRAGAFYRMAVRLRYRLTPEGIVWFFELYRADVIFDAAFQEACEVAQKETDLPLLYGLPESLAAGQG